jgi:hypothetical protein
MIRQTSQGIRVSEKPVTAFGEKLKEALERKQRERAAQ